MLVDGKWSKEWNPIQKKDKQGRFIRQESQFRADLDADSVQAIQNQDNNASPRYCLYVGYICPWATRTLIARQLLGLEKYISVGVVQPALTENGWQFGHYQGNDFTEQKTIRYIHELYTQADPHYSGRATIPVLWDTQQHTIINNESSDILRVFNNTLRPIHQSKIDLYPSVLHSEIDAFNERIYHSFNNGVYRTGFASTQVAYEEAVTEVFATLNYLENHFSQQKYAVGTQLTESDIKLFVTLIRFDVAYHGLFKTNLKRIEDYSAISAYMARLLKIPAFNHTTHIDHIKTGYYSIKALNPTGIIPSGPVLPWMSQLTTEENNG